MTDDTVKLVAECWERMVDANHPWLADAAVDWLCDRSGEPLVEVAAELPGVAAEWAAKVVPTGYREFQRAKHSADAATREIAMGCFATARRTARVAADEAKRIAKGNPGGMLNSKFAVFAFDHFAREIDRATEILMHIDRVVMCGAPAVS